MGTQVAKGKLLNAIGRLSACAAAVSALASCGDRAADRAAGPAGEGVTINLAEPATPAVHSEPANLAGENAQSNFTAVADAAPAPKADAPAKKPLEKVAEPSRKREPPEDAAPVASAQKDRTPQVPAERASLPLPDAVVVRTIERIGYPCGSIVSSARIEGASGSSDYRIDCSSGASYRASNRTGRYRFSKAD